MTDLHLVEEIGPRWVPLQDLIDQQVASESDIERLLQIGLLEADDEGIRLPPECASSSELEKIGWPEEAVRFYSAAMSSHLQSRARDAQPETDFNLLQDNATSDSDSFIERYGPPPEAFLDRGRAQQPIKLPEPDLTGDLRDALESRRTCRNFSGDALDASTFGLMLRWVFGCRGFYKLSDQYRVVHKTSPSGGGLHPVEAYPLILGVQGLEAGLYHYRPLEHEVSLIRALDERDGRSLLTKMSAGQSYLYKASFAVILTARFERNFWKYREVARTLSVIYQDAGHLSQSFYLLAARLGIGACYTGAVASDIVSESLTIDPWAEGPIGICAAGPMDLDTERVPVLNPHTIR